MKKKTKKPPSKPYAKNVTTNLQNLRLNAKNSRHKTRR